MVSVLLIIITTILLIIIINIGMNYIDYINASTKSWLVYEYVNFKTFLKEFDEYKKFNNVRYMYNRKNKHDRWICLFDYKKSRLTPIVRLDYKTVRFDNKYFVFSIIDWIRYLFWMREFCENKVNIG